MIHYQVFDRTWSTESVTSRWPTWGSNNNKIPFDFFQCRGYFFADCFKRVSMGEAFAIISIPNSLHFRGRELLNIGEKGVVLDISKCPFFEPIVIFTIVYQVADALYVIEQP